MTNIEEALVLYNKGVLAFQKGEISKAKDFYIKAIELNPNYADTYYNLALIFASSDKNYEDSIIYYNKAIELDPNLAKAYNNLGNIYKDYKEDFKKAKDYYEKAIKINPNLVEAYNNLGIIYNENLKIYEKAREYFERAIDLNPTSPDAYHNLAFLLSSHFKEHEKAIQLFTKYTELTKIAEDDFIQKYSKKIESIGCVSISRFFSIKDIEIKKIKDSKEIYFLGENGDGKTILLQAIFLAFQQNYIKNYANKALVGEAIESLSVNSEVLLEANVEKGYEFGNLRLNFSENIFAYGVTRNRLEGVEDKYNFMTLFSDKVRLNNPTEWLQKLDYYESRKDYKSPFPLKEAINILKDILDENIEIEVNPDEVAFIERGTKLKFTQLSDGYKSVLIWISDLIVKLSKTQPDAKTTKDFEGVVLVDEIDLHLHPKWSYSIVGKLRAWFPKIQWIFTTHSPVVTLAASKDAVFYKLYKENGEVKVNGPFQNLNMTANSLLTSLLWKLDTFTTKDIDPNAISSDDYVYQKIHEVVSKRIQDVPNLVDKDILKMIEDEFDKIDS